MLLPDDREFDRVAIESLIEDDGLPALGVGEGIAQSDGVDRGSAVVQKGVDDDGWGGAAAARGAGDAEHERNQQKTRGHTIEPAWPAS